MISHLNSLSFSSPGPNPNVSPARSSTAFGCATISAGEDSFFPILFFIFTPFTETCRREGEKRYFTSHTVFAEQLRNCGRSRR